MVIVMRDGAYAHIKGPDVLGFTFIEVIFVLLIIAIVAVIAMARLSSTSVYSVISEADILKTNLRFAQIKAMGDISPDTWSITVSPDGKSYALSCVGSNCPAVTPSLPGGDSPTYTFGGGVTASPATISFDNWGSPGGTTLTVALTGGSQTNTVTITKNTGFIP